MDIFKHAKFLVIVLHVHVPYPVPILDDYYMQACSFE